jgi:hypothetical protein
MRTPSSAPRNRTLARPIAATLFACLLISVGGCSLLSEKPDKSAPILSPAAVLGSAKEYSRVIQEALGGKLVDYAPHQNDNRCTGRKGEVAGPDGPRSLFYADQVILPAEQHRAAVERVREALLARGFVVTEGITEFPKSGGVRLRVENPQDGFEIQVLSTSPPLEIGISVHSPCYLPPSASPSAWQGAVGAGPQVT